VLEIGEPVVFETVDLGVDEHFGACVGCASSKPLQPASRVAHGIEHDVLQVMRDDVVLRELHQHGIGDERHIGMRDEHHRVRGRPAVALELRIAHHDVDRIRLPPAEVTQRRDGDGARRRRLPLAKVFRNARRTAEKSQPRDRARAASQSRRTACSETERASPMVSV
jgi:hypothetical protein